VILGDVRVEDPEGSDYFAPGVGEQRIFDLVRFSETAQNFRRIVGDRCGVDAAFF
jgi:hypothetical protein